jgi:hypothetical protein
MLTQLALQQPQAENVHVEETFGFAAAPALWVIALVVIPFIVAFSRCAPACCSRPCAAWPSRWPSSC